MKATQAQIKMEALRAAKRIVKAEIVKAGDKVSSFAAKDITDWAKEVISRNPNITKNAKRRLNRVHQ